MSELCPMCGESLATDGKRTWCVGDQCGFGEVNVITQMASKFSDEQICQSIPEWAYHPAIYDAPIEQRVKDIIHSLQFLVDYALPMKGSTAWGDYGKDEIVVGNWVIRPRFK